MTQTLIPPKNVPIPKNSDELAEMLGDPGKLKPIVETPAALAGFIDAYAQERQGVGTEMHTQVENEVQKQLADFLREKDVSDENADRINRLNLSPQATNKRSSMLTSYGQGARHNPKAPGAAIDDKFTTAVDYISAIWHLNSTPAALAKKAEITNAAGSVSPADGGFLVPETMRAQLLEIALEMAVVRSRATVVPMDSARVPFPMIDVSTNSTSLFGGMIAYWGEESAALVDSNPKFGRVELDAKKLTGLSVVPNELLQDSIISFSALVERLWPQCLAFEEDSKFMTGTGVGEPLGFLGAGNPAAISVAAEVGQGADTILYQNIVKMYARMMPASLNKAVWLVSPDTLPELFTMALSVGTGGNSIFIANAAGAAPMTLLGRPIVITEKAGKIGDLGDISFVDLSYYLLGDRQSMSAASSTDYRFGTDQTTFRIIQRVDGRPWIQSAVTPKNGGNPLSPFVSLAAR